MERRQAKQRKRKQHFTDRIKGIRSRDNDNVSRAQTQTGRPEENTET